MSSTHHYRIAVKDALAHLIEVRVTVKAPDPDGQVFRIPAWIPGSYMIRDYARNVVAIRAESDGVDVALAKLDKSSWQAVATTRPLTLILDVYAYDSSVRGAHLDNTHWYFNGPCVFPVVAGQEDSACELEIDEPGGKYAQQWRVATSMRRKSAEQYGFGSFIADNYDELIDHPVEVGVLTIGEFEVLGIPHAIAIRGRTHCDMARLCQDLKVLCEKQHEFLGTPVGLDRYLFLLHAPGQGYGGLEHRWSSSLVCARDCLPRKGEGEVSPGYRTFLGLASHEYFHLWNVKRLKPRVFEPFDLSQEVHTELLWVFEGITSYYDDLMLLRSGLIGEKSYLELLGRTMTRVARGAGSKRQSVADSSYDAWTKFYKQDENAANAIVSYYAKGSLIALALDLKLRQETAGATTLDDVMRVCWERWGDTGDGMPERGLEAVAAEVSGLDLEDFFDACVRGTGELPLVSLLRTHGVALEYRASAGADDKGGSAKSDDKTLAVWLGASLVAKADESVFVSVSNGGPAEKAGVAPGDKAVALDGLRLTAKNLQTRLQRIRDKDVFDLHVFRGDELLALKIRFKAAPLDTCYLTLLDEVDLDTETRRVAWLAT
jgi:predicted metalloprotease with PDZ domain